MQKKKELTAEQKKALAMKYEIAEELGLLEKVQKVGWKGLTSRESGKIGGIMGKRKRQEQKNHKNDSI
ncbi:MAG TPA: small, acid-soluble spore protein, alpha/beta type [Candidatus Coprocola pullicola]|nr:small, acid-soluble spore protein, alpha/beta type [Candidatus Coprocola pullicola]